MARPALVDLTPQPLERYRALLGDRFGPIEEAARQAREWFDGRVIWNVNSTAQGGGVAEMLRAFLPYALGAGVDTRWVVLQESGEFFVLTKRIHNNLHGHAGDGGGLGSSERILYEDALADSAGHLAAMVRPGDVVLLHDPQTAGLSHALLERGVIVIWRCHIGVDDGNDLVRRAEAFLHPHIAAAHACVFSRDSYVWPDLDPARIRIMAPAIDAFSPKNQELDEATVEGVIGTIGLSDSMPASAPEFTREDGRKGTVARRAELLQETPLPEGAPLVTQISRWDRLKDHAGLMSCFARHMTDRDSHLALVGPAGAAVSDDPEGERVLAEIEADWHALPQPVRHRVHLVSLPMDDLAENAVMVNAIQRRSTVLVQKSLAEGFGLTVAEGMWKSRPMVASRIGGIQDQIVDGTGVLVDDPTDLSAFGRAIDGLLRDPAAARRMGRASRERIEEKFLVVQSLAGYAVIFNGLIGR